MDPNNNVYRFKLVLLGDGATGKTTYVKRIKEGCFVRRYEATQGVETSEIQLFFSNGASIIYEVWDTAGQEIYGQLSEIYYLGAHAAIIMYNVTSRSTFVHVQKWLHNLRQVTDDMNLPVVVCGNMVDLADRKVKHQQVVAELGTKVYKTCDISAKTSYNFEKPFLFISRALLNDPTLEFAGNVQLAPDTISLQEGMDASANIQKAKSMDLPDDDL